MIERYYDPDFINLLINEPTIRPTVGGNGYLDATSLLEDQRNICLADEGGGAIFVWSGPGVYHGHSFFLARGREAIDLGQRMLGYMSDEANLIWGLTPRRLRHVRWFNRQIGMKSLGLMDTPDGQCELFEMRY